MTKNISTDQKFNNKLHLIGVGGTEILIDKLKLQLSENFKDITQEVIPYMNFANGETKIEFKESVRERIVYLLTDRYGIYSPLTTKYNDKLMQEFFLIQCAKNHGAKQIGMLWVPQYSEPGEESLSMYNEKELFESVFGLPYSLKRDFKISGTHHLSPKTNAVKNIIKEFDMKNRMSTPAQEKIHLIGTQDTAWLVESMKQYLISTLWEGVVTSEVSLYKESNIWVTQIDLKERVENKHVYVIGDVNGKKRVEGTDTITYNDRLVQQFLLLKHARDYRAKTVNYIPTCFPYSRQDKPSQWWLKERVTREPSLAQFMLDIIEYFGVDYCITMDIHNPAVVNNSRTTKFVNLYTWRAVQHVLNILKTKWKISPSIAPMDEWWLKKIAAIAKDLKVNNLTVIKSRDYSKISAVDEIAVFGEVKDKDILVHDDMLDTGGSLLKLIEKLNELGARSINIVITHGMFNKDAIGKIQALYEQGKFEKIYVTNTVYRDPEFYPEWVEVIDAAVNFADPIRSIYSSEKINYNYGVNWSTTHY